MTKATAKRRALGQRAPDKDPTSDQKPSAQGAVPSSGEEAQEDVLAERFFSEPPDSLKPMELWDEAPKKPQQSPGSRRAMFATFGMLAVFLVGIGSYTIYAKLIMPAPVELGVTSELEPVRSPESWTASQPSDQALQALAAASAQPSQPSSLSESVPPGPAEASQTPQAEAPAAGQATVGPPLEGSEVTATSEPPALEAQVSPQAPQAAESQQLAGAAPLGSTAPSGEAKPDGRDTEKAVARADSGKSARSTGARKPRRGAAAATAADRHVAKGAKPVLYRDIVARANRLYRKRSTRRLAVKEYGRAVSINPNGVEALLKLAYHSFNSSKYGAAELFALRAVKASPGSAQGWFLLGAARDALSDREGAQKAYKRCAQAKGAYSAQCRRLGGSRG